MTGAPVSRVELRKLPFRDILLSLLQTTEGSLGALFLDWEGETVEAITERPLDADDHDLRVIGAYQGIFRTQLHKVCESLGAGHPHRLKMEFARTKVLTTDLADGYYLVLIVESHTNEGLAWHRLERARESLLAEM
jgi:predicted regulator of Ras-like GTPase activity (Roadblock/LC7/MglB family)